MKLVARCLRPAGTENAANTEVATLSSPGAATPQVPANPGADSAVTATPRVPANPGSDLTGTAGTGRGGLLILTELTELSHRENVSDLQIQAGKLVYINRAGSTKAYEQFGKLSFEDVYQMLDTLYRARTVFNGFDAGAEKDDLRERLMAERKLDFACEGKDPNSPLRGRFRVQAHFSHAGLGMTLRVLRNKLAQLEQCGLPQEVLDSLRQRVLKKQGLGLVVGPTGSGKTTTLSALIDWVRRNHHKHIVTVEDPIEYCYPETVDGAHGSRPSPALVTQQEVGHHVKSFDQGLNDSLRKKPDIILVGEIRTAETLKTALEAAETGHFILSTLHTRGAGKTLGRMRQMFNLEQARSVLQQYADVGSFILSQGLMPDTTGKYVLCCEYFSIQEIEDRNAIRKYVDGSFQDVEERLNKPYNRRWNNELKALLAARRISQETFDQFYQVTGLENK
jgi:twitching motility protein PilT